MFKKLNKKGFTLAELLIVVAIIGVLVAVSIPIFTAQLEKSREATDIANLRAAKAEAVAAYLTQENIGTGTTDWKVAVAFQYDPLTGKLATSGVTATMKGTTNNPGTYNGTNNEYGYNSGTDYSGTVIGGSIATDGTITWSIKGTTGSGS